MGGGFVKHYFTFYKIIIVKMNVKYICDSIWHCEKLFYFCAEIMDKGLHYKYILE